MCVVHRLWGQKLNSVRCTLVCCPPSLGPETEQRLFCDFLNKGTIMSLKNQSSGLASLTATYTDSEGEEEEEEEEEEEDQDEEEEEEGRKEEEEFGQDDCPPSNTPGTGSGQSGTLTPVTGVKGPGKLTHLVSYNDDMVHSDEETQEESIETDDKKKENVEVEDETKLDEGLFRGYSDVKLPPEPSGRCSNELQEKITRLYEKMVRDGLDMNKVIQKMKDFRNPSIYEKLIQFCDIDEMGTNYPIGIYDPHRWGKESFYDELAKRQKAEMDKREKKEKTKVEFVLGTAKKPGLEEDGKKRKSKWDQVGATQGATVSVIKPAGFVQQPSLTTNATGTKATLISAFGSLPKKTKT